MRCQAEGKVDSSPTLNFGWGQVPTTKFHYRPQRYKYTDRPLDFPNIALRPRQIILPSPPGDTQSPTSWRKTSMKNRPLNTNLQTPKRQLLDYASVTSQHPPKTNAHPNTGMISPYHISIDKTQPTLTFDTLPDSRPPGSLVPIPPILDNPSRFTSDSN